MVAVLTGCGGLDIPAEIRSGFDAARAQSGVLRLDSAVLTPGAETWNALIGRDVFQAGRPGVVALDLTDTYHATNRRYIAVAHWLPDPLDPNQYVEVFAPFLEYSSADRARALLHELGHLLGLDHTGDGCLMAPVLERASHTPCPSEVAAVRAVWLTDAPPRE